MAWLFMAALVHLQCLLFSHLTTARSLSRAPGQWPQQPAVTAHTFLTISGLSCITSLFSCTPLKTSNFHHRAPGLSRSPSQWPLLSCLTAPYKQSGVGHPFPKFPDSPALPLHLLAHSFKTSIFTTPSYMPPIFATGHLD